MEIERGQHRRLRTRAAERLRLERSGSMDIERGQHRRLRARAAERLRPERSGSMDTERSEHSRLSVRAAERLRLERISSNSEFERAWCLETAPAARSSTIEQLSTAWHLRARAAELLRLERSNSMEIEREQHGRLRAHAAKKLRQ